MNKKPIQPSNPGWILHSQRKLREFQNKLRMKPVKKEKREGS